MVEQNQIRELKYASYTEPDDAPLEGTIKRVGKLVFYVSKSGKVIEYRPHAVNGISKR